MPDDPEELPPETPSPQDATTAYAGDGPTGGSTWRQETPGGTGATRLSSADAPAEVIGDFEIIGKLGQGGMGAVYRARQRSLDRQVALKILPATLEADPEFVSRFQREARIAASLNHANLVRVYASGQAAGCHYIAMELIEGETLGEWLRRSALPPVEALRITLDVARALECGWRSAQLIHRDIKPGNIFLSADGAVKLGDLGLAKTMSGDSTGLTQTGTAMGTPHYISPEQARGDKDLDFRADIYSLGCTLYQMLTGRTPYEGRDPVKIFYEHIHAPPPAILKMMPQCPIPLARLVSKTLKKQKRERHSSYQDLIADLERVHAMFAPAASALEGVALPSEPEATMLQEPASTPTPRPSTATIPVALARKPRLPLYAGIAAAIIFLAIGGIFFAFSKKEEPLTKAQLYAQERAAEEAARRSAVPSDAAAPVFRAPAADTPAIKLWNTALGLPQRAGVSWEDNALKLHRNGLQYSAVPSRDMILRVAVRANPDSEGAQFAVRHRGGERYRLQWVPAGPHVDLILVRNDKGESSLGHWKLPRSYTEDEYIPLELRAVGDLLTVSTGGHVLGTVKDTSYPGPGGIWLYANANGYFRDIEYVPLDGAAGRSSGAPAAEPWQDVLRDPAKLVLSGAVERTAEGLRFSGYGTAVPSQRSPQRNGAVRMRATHVSTQLQLRGRSSKLGHYILMAGTINPVIQLVRWEAGTGNYIKVKDFALSEPLHIDQDYELELRTVGSNVTVRLNGQVLSTVMDTTFAEGNFSIVRPKPDGDTALVKSIEVLDLDKADGATVTPIETFAFGGHSYELVREKLNWSDAKARAEASGGHLATFSDEAEEQAMRGWLSTLSPPLDSLEYYWVGGVIDKGAHEPRWITGEQLGSLGWVPGHPNWRTDPNSVETKPFGLLPEAGLAVGDGKDSSRGWVIALPRSRIRAGFVLERDAAQGATHQGSSVTPATATKDAPFVNSLGMKFVPVPITGGPTSGQRVLFSIWETRVQDYEAFVKATGRVWQKVGFGQEPTHPAVMVSWENAKAFCAWLTERELKAGKLVANEVYRLPSDHEWSCGAMIGDREDPAKEPIQKEGKLQNVFVWGQRWPPPAETGNFKMNERPDAYPYTAPVGAFAANAAGLHDLAGNAWEWCEDLFKTGEENRVLRGASCFDGAPDILAASRRIGRASTYFSETTGFRVVLAADQKQK